MNQILCTKIKKNYSKKNFFKLQFSFSILIILIIILISFFYINSLIEKEKISNNIINNYNIYKLYSNLEGNDNINNSTTAISNNIFGIIEIPKINIYYPVFSNISEDLLKISPCKFYGETLEDYDNICIAGHNYNNSLFFSNINLLSQNDEIILYDNLGNYFSYFVYDIYEVKYNDLTPLYNFNKNSYELTLVTCNNFNSDRIIVKAKRK